EIERLQRVISEAVASERERGHEVRGPDSGGDPQSWLSGAADDYGVPYATYEALKLSSVTDQLADLLAEAWSIDTDSALGRGIRTLASEWRHLEYPGFEDRRRFLLQYDIEYRLRRIRYARRRLQEEYAEPTIPPDVAAGELPTYAREYRAELQQIKAKLGPPYR